MYYSHIFFMVAQNGIEPPTRGFSVLCSTNWATGPFLLKKRLADHTGIEPVIFSVTGRHVNRYTNGPSSQRFYIIMDIKTKCKYKL